MIVVHVVDVIELQDYKVHFVCLHFSFFCLCCCWLLVFDSISDYFVKRRFFVLHFRIFGTTFCVLKRRGLKLFFTSNNLSKCLSLLQ